MLYSIKLLRLFLFTYILLSKIKYAICFPHSTDFFSFIKSHSPENKQKNKHSHLIIFFLASANGIQ